MTVTCKRILAGGLWTTAVAVTTAMLAGCGGSNDNTPPQQQVTAQQACDALNGKTIAGATVTAVAVAASGAVPTYCKVSGNIAPSLNFEMRLPQTWNGKLHYGGGGGHPVGSQYPPETPPAAVPG